jgi:hypothetical protein
VRRREFFVSHPATTLAATVHDVDGRLVSALRRLAPVLRDVFTDIALNLSDATPAAVAGAARDLLDAATMVHAQGEAIIGRARREALQLALSAPSPQILYSDFDHILRWIDAAPDELRATLAAQPAADLLVVGRSPRAFAAEPRRLQDTEQVVNHVYKLTTGQDWDLMAAIRRFSRAGAEAVLAKSTVDTIANDVEWPLLARQLGLPTGYVETDAFSYRTMQEFGAPADTGDGDAANWIKRVEFAAMNLAVMRRFLRGP